jgi:hypothetical protein
MQATGKNLLEAAFEQVTDEQISVLKLKTGKLRMDSVQIASNIRQMSRLQLLVEVLQRVWRMLTEVDQAQYAGVFEPYTQGTSGQYTYRLEPGEGHSHLEAIGQVLRRLVSELAADYGAEAAYAVLERVYHEHFSEVEQAVRPKAGTDLSAQSLQSPDDLEATYRQKRGVGYQGYVTNVTETCDLENGLQLIVKVQSAPNSTDDATLLNEVVPNLVERTHVEELHTDGGYNSADVDATLTAHGIEQFQTAIRGAQAATNHLSVSDFVFSRDAEGVPQTVTCPQGQQVAVLPARNPKRFTALFDATLCADCPLLAQCPTRSLRRKPYRVLRFTQQAANVAHRRANQRQAKASRHNLRSAVEATVRSLKHPFGNAKLSVRGLIRVSMTMVASACMTNVRRISRYQQAKISIQSTLMTAENSLTRIGSHLFQAVLRPVFHWVAILSQPLATAA